VSLQSNQTKSSGPIQMDLDAKWYALASEESRPSRLRGTGAAAEMWSKQTSE
jgi:hypothetical protein